MDCLVKLRCVFLQDWAICTDTEGSFSCTCNRGFAGDGMSCGDIDECADGWHTCFADDATCTNTGGSFQCGCVAGYTGDGIASCSDVNECLLQTHNCHVRSAAGESC